MRIDNASRAAVLPDQRTAGPSAGGIGAVVGVAVLLVGIVVGGRTLDRTGPLLLSRLKAMKNA